MAATASNTSITDNNIANQAVQPIVSEFTVQSLQALYNTAGALIDDALESNGGRVYRRQVNMQVTVDTMADSLFIRTDSRLKGYFRPAVLSINASSPYRTGNWPGGSGGTVSLIRPWHVLKIKASGSGSVELKRIDGDAIADEATVSGNVNALLTPEFVSDRFVAETSKTITVVDVASYPTGLRIGIGTPAWNNASAALNQEALNVTWQEPGEHRGSVLFDISGDQLAAVLQPLLADVLANRPSGQTQLVIPIIVQSDVPCKLDLTDNSLNHEQQINRFALSDAAAALDKQVLRFSGKRNEQQWLSVPWPNGSVSVTQFSWQMNISRQGEGNSTSTHNADLLGPAGDAALQQRHGVLTTTAQQISIPVRLENARQLTGVWLALVMLEQSADVTVLLSADQSGKPSGEVLSQATVQLKELGVRNWFSFQWPTLLVPSGDYWLTLQSAQGRVLWLGEADATAQASVYQRSDTGAAGGVQQSKKITAFKTFYHFMLAVQDVQAEQSGDSTNTLAPPAMTDSLRLTVGQTVLSGVDAGGNTQFDLTAAAATIIPSNGSAAIAAVSGTKSVVTVYPPTIRYTIND